MAITQRTTPYLWFKDNNAQEAMEYYINMFPNSRIAEVMHYPDQADDPHLQNMQGKVLTGVFWLDGQQFMCLDGNDMGWDFNNAVSFLIECENQEDIDYYWSKLSAKPDDEQCGWCTDRYGVRWQIVPTDMGSLLQTPAQMNVMMKQKKIIIQELQDAA